MIIICIIIDILLKKREEKSARNRAESEADVQQPLLHTNVQTLTLEDRRPRP